jgi:hypothetical protein
MMDLQENRATGLRMGVPEIKLNDNKKLATSGYFFRKGTHIPPCGVPDSFSNSLRFQEKKEVSWKERPDE